MQRIAIRIETRSQGKKFLCCWRQRRISDIGPDCSVVRLRESHRHRDRIEAFIVFLARKWIFADEVNSPEFLTPPRDTWGRPGFIFFYGRRKERVLVMLYPRVAITAFGEADRVMKAEAIEGNPFKPKRELVWLSQNCWRNDRVIIPGMR